MGQFQTVIAQNLESIKDIKDIKKKKPIEFGGSFGVGASYYNSNQSYKRSAPYNWFVSGSPWMKLYGLNIPFTFTYSETGRSLSHPFHYNFSGASPYYKWATTHIGFRSMNFSEYTLSGVVFKGIGVELKPKKFRFSAFYGVFNAAVEIDSNNADFGVILPSYKRIGYGTSIGIGTDKNYFDLSYFRGRDDAKSLRDEPTFENIKPMDNVSFGPKFKVTLFKRYFIESDVALSVLTRNVLNDTLKSSEELRTIYQFVRVNTTTYGAFAGHVTTGVNYKTWGLSFRARQISSDYQSLGINLLQDDLREFTASPNIRFFKGKLNLNGSYGFYTDNVSGKRLNTTKRNILNTNLSATPGKRLNISFGYSNFGTTRTNGFTQMNDSITFSIINENYNGSVGYKIGNKKRPVMVSLFAQMQQAQDRNIFTAKYNNSKVFNAGINSQYKFEKSKLQLSGGLAYAKFNAGNGNVTTYNFQSSAKKAFFKDKLSTALSLNYSQRFSNEQKQGDVLSSNVSIQTQLGKHHSIQTQFRLMRNTTGVVSNIAFNEQRVAIQYGFNF